MPDRLSIVYLADRPDLAPVVARWQQAEWGRLGGSLEKRLEKLGGHLNRDSVPLTLVALRGPRAVGSADLVWCDLPARKDLSPWLASVVVVPESRRGGIGSALVRRAVGEAGRLGFSQLYLFTWDQERLYADLGWQAVERARVQGEPIVVMSIATGSDRSAD